MSQLNSLSASAVELLTPFTDPSHAVRKNVLVMDSYRGDGTETGDRRFRAMLGDAYESLHHDTVACNGQVAIFMPRCIAPGASEAPFGFRLLTAEHHWALGEIDERSAEVTHARGTTIQRVPLEAAKKLYALPDLEFVEVCNVNYWVSGNGPSKRKKKPAPQDVVYFRFSAGYGVVVC